MQPEEDSGEAKGRNVTKFVHTMVVVGVSVRRCMLIILVNLSNYSLHRVSLLLCYILQEFMLILLRYSSPQNLSYCKMTEKVKTLLQIAYASINLVKDQLNHALLELTSGCSCVPVYYAWMPLKNGI